MAGHHSLAGRSVAAAAFATVFAYSTLLPPLLVSTIGKVLNAKTSPVCTTPCAGNTTQASPPVCAGPKYRSSMRSVPVPRESVDRLKVRVGRPRPLLSAKHSGCGRPAGYTGRMLRISVAVVSCATTSTLPGNSGLLPTWSSWVWVLMMVVTGLSVTDLRAAMIAAPRRGNFVSTSATPSDLARTPESVRAAAT